MEKYFMIAPVLSETVQSFKEYAGISGRTASMVHHEHISTKSTKMIKDSSLIVKQILKKGNPFHKTEMFNLVTFAVPPANIQHDIENHDDLGKNALAKFVKERMTEETVHSGHHKRQIISSISKMLDLRFKRRLKDRL